MILVGWTGEDSVTVQTRPYATADSEIILFWWILMKGLNITVMRLCKPSDNSLVDVNYSLCSSILPSTHGLFSH